jgi:FtsP/CotA-like multicopper oxidase with cupredoxin domain
MRTYYKYGVIQGDLESVKEGTLRLWFTLTLALSFFSATAQDTLYINTGMWEQSADTMLVLRFNSENIFDTSNVAISMPSNSVQSLTVINLDSFDHEFSIGGIAEFVEAISSGDTTTFELPSQPMGTYRYYTSDERGLLLGANGVLKVGLDESLDQFHWNLVDWMPERMDSVANANEVTWGEPYVPRYFSINSFTYPHTPLDANGYVAVNLGETCLISIVNNGFMDHVLHFHGFHVEYISSTMQADRVGWIKDTIPLLMGEGVTLKLIANQTGIYPVHNHNLIAVTNSGFYPGGMLTLINVAP